MFSADYLSGNRHALYMQHHLSLEVEKCGHFGQGSLLSEVITQHLKLSHIKFSKQKLRFHFKIEVLFKSRKNMYSKEKLTFYTSV